MFLTTFLILDGTSKFDLEKSVLRKNEFIEGVFGTMIFFTKPLGRFISLFLTISLLLVGCADNKNPQGNTPAPTNETQAKKAEIKTKPDSMTKLKFGVASWSLQYWPLFVAEKQGLFKKYNLDLEIVRVESGVVAIRGLQSGDFKLISSLPESVLVAASEGANAKFIGTFNNQSMYQVLVSPNIKSVQDLKGKIAGTFQPGNGTDTQLKWWLKKNGLEPDKDIRIVNSGGIIERYTALMNGNVQATLVTPPYNYQAIQAGFKELAVMRDELKTYNHDTIVANGTVLKNEPEVARAFMAAIAEAIEFIKKDDNQQEVIKIGMEKMEMSEEYTKKLYDFLLPSMPDKGKLLVEGIEWAISTSKEAGALKKDISITDVVDENYYIK